MEMESKVKIIILKARCAANVAAFPAGNPVNVVISALIAQKKVNPCVAS
jgi:hypothetical protein